MSAFQWGIPITGPDEVTKIEGRLREFNQPGEPIPEDDLLAMEKASGRKFGVPYYCPEAFGRIEGL